MIFDPNELNEKKNPDGIWSLEGGIRVTGLKNPNVAILRDDIGKPLLTIALITPDQGEAAVHEDKIYGLLVKRTDDGTILSLQVDFTRELDFDVLEGNEAAE